MQFLVVKLVIALFFCDDFIVETLCVNKLIIIIMASAGLLRGSVYYENTEFSIIVKRNCLNLVFL